MVDAEVDQAAETNEPLDESSSTVMEHPEAISEEPGSSEPRTIDEPVAEEKTESRPAPEPPPRRERDRDREHEHPRRHERRSEPQPPVPEFKTPAVTEAIEQVTKVVEDLKNVLNEMEELLETLELAERQKIDDEREIEALNRALRQLRQHSPGGHRR